jgi:hypothetical protein
MLRVSIRSNRRILLDGSSFFYPFFTEFCSVYLKDRFEDDYFLSPESSLALNLESTTIPTQVFVCTCRNVGDRVSLPNDISIIISHSKIKSEGYTELVDGLRALTLQAAIANLLPSFFRSRSHDFLMALSCLSNVSELTQILVKEKALTQANRLYSALLKIGRVNLASQLVFRFQSLSQSTQISLGKSKNSDRRPSRSGCPAKVEMFKKPRLPNFKNYRLIHT